MVDLVILRNNGGDEGWVNRLDEESMVLVWGTIAHYVTFNDGADSRS